MLLYRCSVSDKALILVVVPPLTPCKRTCPMALLLASDIKINGFPKLGWTKCLDYGVGF